MPALLWHMTSLALVLLMASEPAKPKVELKANPSFAMLGIGPRASATVRFRLTVKDGGDENFYCPRIEWEWEDETKATEESDCPPFESAQKEDHERTWTKSHQFWEPGNHVIRARLYKGDKLIRTLDAKVEVSGEATPGRFRER
jgi:hypothetical protein